MKRTIAWWTLAMGLVACGARSDLSEYGAAAPASGTGSSTRSGSSSSSQSASSSSSVRGPTLTLFGGGSRSGSTQVTLADTWIWDGAAWTQENVTGPPARESSAATSLSGTMVVFGGLGSTGESLRDTWTWDGAAWSADLAPGPDGREGCGRVPEQRLRDLRGE